MNKDQKKKYLVAIYLSIAFLAIIFVLIAPSIANTTWQSFLLNLSTELIGAAFIFIVVNFLFFVDEWDLSERVNKLLNRLDSNGHSSAEDFFKKRPDLNPYISESQRIDLCGVNRSGTLHKYFDTLLDQLLNNCKLRVLIVDDGNNCAIETSAQKTKVNDKEHLSQQIKQSKRRLAQLYEAQRKQQDQPRTNSIEVRLLPYSPSFGITAFDSDTTDGTVFVEIFPQKSPDKSPEFELTSQNDGGWYDFFVVQFEVMWAHAKLWPPAEYLSRDIVEETE